MSFSCSIYRHAHSKTSNSFASAHTNKPILSYTFNYWDCSYQAYTHFYIMRTHRIDKVWPAQAVVDSDVANLIADAIVAEGLALQNALEKMQVVVGDSYTADWHINLQNLSTFFVDHCAVMTGHLPSHYWPKYHRLTQEELPLTICTCQMFSQHASCEHQYFVLGLNALPGQPTNFNDMPDVSKKGRPKKSL